MIGLVAVLAIMGIVWLVSGDDAATGPGPVGPVGPAGSVGPIDAGPGNTVEGSGVIVTEVRDVGEFDSVVLEGLGDVTITIGDSSSLLIRTDDNLMPLITSRLEGSALRLATDDPSIDPTEGVTYEIMTPRIATLMITGVGDVAVHGLTTETLGISLIGVGNITVSELDTELLVIAGSGIGDIEVTGRAVTQDVSIAGSVTYLGGNLRTGSATVEVGDRATATVWVADDLAAVVTDVASISYYGTPAVSGTVDELRSLGDK